MVPTIYLKFLYPFLVCMIFRRALGAGWTWVGQHLLTPLLRRCAGRGGWGGQAAQAALAGLEAGPQDPPVCAFFLTFT